MRSPYPYPPSWLGGIVLGESPLGSPNDFPVAAGLQKTILSYLYQQYAGDNSLEAFVAAYNQLTQAYVDWFCAASLPIYTMQSGSQLDWIANGLYGFLRPLLPIGQAKVQSAIPKAFMPNGPGSYPNFWEVIEQDTYYQTTDDVFQRIMTWFLYKGDGKQINVKWLKRRVMRFLSGIDGTGGAPIPSDIVMAKDSNGAPVYWPTFYNIDNTTQISVEFAGGEATIRILSGIRKIIGGCVPNGFIPNGPHSIPNSSTSTYVSFAQFALAPIFQAAVAAGILELPGPYAWNVQLS